METERLILKRGQFDDYVKVYEYDFMKLRNIAGEFEFVKLDSKRIEGFDKQFEETFDWIVYLKNDKIPIANIVADESKKISKQ